MSKIKKIIVRVPNWIGDAVLCTPALHLLRKSFPSASITALAKEWVAPALKANPDIDRIIVMTEKESYFELAGKIAVNKFETGILFPNSFSSALLFRLARIPKRIGYSTNGRSLLLTQRIKRPLNFKKEHQVFYYLQLIEKYLSITGNFRSNQEMVKLIWNITEEEKVGADELLRGANISSQKRLIGINPGAAHGPAKRWFPERFAEVSDELVQKYDARIAIFGSPDERKTAISIAEMMKFKPLNFAGKTNLRQLAAIISRCQLFVTNDTGNMHIAAAVGTPVVTIFGPTDSRRTAPRGNGHIIVQKKIRCSPCMKKNCPKRHHKCMKAIKAQDILDAVENRRFLK
ncbi:lipopolysaccharide heptosyltransferase II [candidate division NPL-UPA2 bacterium Unc8]|uniref:lipopolysaccharide heptosyltransferase II n=1 Tax=candidate division NPL-UPA2 bacterium Unc8 TaxID=1980939 RepID=A0A399FWN1_UNCN2|nr:ADP-heptose--LPS heptosyltransferase 2 [Bacillota bacterium]RII00581.1 MAG: lipopolysaccharide heptosyltransferase II [candidate division NPL-UPA2 bacterium Unc8]